MSDADAIHKQLYLEKLSDDQLKSIAEGIAKLEANGFAATDIFPVGIITQYGAGANFEIAADQLPGFVKDVTALDLRARLKIFPLGIIVNDRFRVETQFGRGDF